MNNNSKLKAQTLSHNFASNCTSLLKLVFACFLTVCLASNANAQENDDPSPLKFPTPKNISNQLFYVQRDPNINTVICQLNVNADGELVDESNPVNVFWIRYDENNVKKDLNYIQRKFAYGVTSKKISTGNYELKFVSYKKLPLYLVKSTTDKKYRVYVSPNNKKMILDRIFLRIEGGTFWVPNVKYVEFKGYDASNPTKIIVERIKV